MPAWRRLLLSDTRWRYSTLGLVDQAGIRRRFAATAFDAAVSAHSDLFGAQEIRSAYLPPPEPSLVPSRIDSGPPRAVNCSAFPHFPPPSGLIDSAQPGDFSGLPTCP